MDCSGSGEGQVAGICECGKKFGFHKMRGTS